MRATWGHRSRGDRFRAPCGNFEFAQNHRLHRTLRSKTRFHFCMGNLTFTLEILQLAKVGFRWFSMFPSPGGPNARISAGKTHTMCARLAQGENPPGAGRTPAGALKLPGSRAPLGRRGIPLGKSGFPGVPRAWGPLGGGGDTGDTGPAGSRGYRGIVGRAFSGGLFFAP